MLPEDTEKSTGLFITASTCSPGRGTLRPKALSRGLMWGSPSPAARQPRRGLAAAPAPDSERVQCFAEDVLSIPERIRGL